jgi:hypothetical protein
MRRSPSFKSSVSAIVGIAIPAAVAWAQNPKPAPEGLGLLPKPVEAPRELGGVPPPHVFTPDPSGGFSRTIFETDDDPDFNITIREYSFPPDKQKHSVVLPFGAFARLLSGPGVITVANNKLDLSSIARAALPPGAPIEVTNTSEYPIVVKLLILEAK